MTLTDMEDRLENLDLRLSRIEQVLPTLATKDDLKVFATKADMAQVESQQRAFTESVIGRMNTLFEGVDARFASVDARFDRVETRLAGVETDVKGVQYSLDRLVQRLEAKSVI